MTLKPLLESSEGVHLTIYLVNRGSLLDLKSQLKESLNLANEWLNPVMSYEEKNKLLEPVNNLISDSRIFKGINGNIGIFRNQESFRVLSVPVEVEETCQVATSFHVKPLLKWLQVDQEFLLLGLEQEAAHLYFGSQNSIKLVDSVVLPEIFKSKSFVSNYLSIKKVRQSKLKKVETYNWLNDWILELTKSSTPKLFLAGEKSVIEPLANHLNYKNTIKNPISNFFSKNDISEICITIRKILKSDSKSYIEKALMEFRFAEEGNRARKNIFQIAKAVVKGRVRKLIVTDELNIFGKVDKDSGGLAIHPFDMDHEDDDILDDLAQMVLSQGGEVIVASRSEIPKGRPILAILDDEEKELEKTKDYAVFEERSG